MFKIWSIIGCLQRYNISSKILIHKNCNVVEVDSYLWSSRSWSKKDLILGVLSGFDSLKGVKSLVWFSKRTVSMSALMRSRSGAWPPPKHRLETTSMKKLWQLFLISFFVVLPVFNSVHMLLTRVFTTSNVSFRWKSELYFKC